MTRNSRCSRDSMAERDWNNVASHGLKKFFGDIQGHKSSHSEGAGGVFVLHLQGTFAESRIVRDGLVL